jgi:hypothetical protein
MVSVVLIPTIFISEMVMAVKQVRRAKGDIGEVYAKID